MPMFRVHTSGGVFEVQAHSPADAHTQLLAKHKGLAVYKIKRVRNK